MASSADKYTAYDPKAPLEEGPGPVGYLALVLAWVVPGLGHMLIGQKARGAIFFVAIHGLFAMGLLIGGIRVIKAFGRGRESFENFDSQCRDIYDSQITRIRLHTRFVWVLGVIWYFFWKQRSKRVGVDVSMTYGELPPE